MNKLVVNRHGYFIFYMLVIYYRITTNEIEKTNVN